MRTAVLLLVGFVALAAGGAIWVVNMGPRMKEQLVQCEAQQTDVAISGCMESQGWMFNRQLISCDNGSAKDIGCYETGLPWP
jgi:hypothetical protein